MNRLTINDIRKRLLVKEAERWLGVSERGGNNKGELVEMFQRSVDGRANGEAWCMAFVQECIRSVDVQTDAILDAKLDREMISQIYKTEHCLTAWNKSSEICRLTSPQMGSVAIWQHGNSSAGHTGIVVSVGPQGFMHVIEGNTSSEDREVNREGDGVYLRRRSVIGQGRMKIKGFLNPWTMDLELSLQ